MSDPSSAARTYLFVPGTRPERFGKALASGADAVVLDLEDAVAQEDKAAARRNITDWLRTAAPVDRARCVVRINDAASDWFADDLAALQGTDVAQILLPKAADLSLARCRGFGAKLCIHPGQVAPIHRALRPSEAEFDWAQRVLAADAATPGVARLDGRMVDLPVVRQARRTLLAAGH